MGLKPKPPSRLVIIYDMEGRGHRQTARHQRQSAGNIDYYREGILHGSCFMILIAIDLTQVDTFQGYNIQS